MRWITLTRYAAKIPVRVNAAAIAFTDATPRGTNVSFGAGETLRVAETPSEIEALATAGSAPLCSVGTHVSGLPWPEHEAALRAAGTLEAADLPEFAQGARRRAAVPGGGRP